jgi:hypothetical protein
MARRMAQPSPGLVWMLRMAMLVSCGGGCGATQTGGDGCASGEFSADGRHPCTACAAGKYQHGETYPTVCSLCPPGRYEVLPGQSVCRGECDRGESSVAGATTQSACTLCHAGKHNSQVAALCIDCVVGMYSLAGAGQSSSSVCIACTAGRYSLAGPGQTNISVCIACVAGTYSLAGTGQTNNSVCIDCVAGTYSLAGAGQSSSSVCIACAAGTYSPAPGGANISVCIACVAGTYSLAGTGQTNSRVCIDCVAGTYS